MKPNDAYRDKDTSSFQAFLKVHLAELKKEIVAKAAMYKARDTYLTDKTLQNLISHGLKTDDEQNEEIESLQKQNTILLTKIDQCEHKLDTLSKTNLAKQYQAFSKWKEYTIYRKKKQFHYKYVSEFYIKGLKLKTMKGWKMISLLLGKKNFVETLETKLRNFQIDLTNQKCKEIDLLTKIKEDLLTQIAIESRKCTILKHQLDQSLLKGATAFSLEALKVSQSNLQEMVIEDKSASITKYFL